MADSRTTARRSARAAFEQSRKAGSLASWSLATGRAAAAVGHKRARALFGVQKGKSK